MVTARAARSGRWWALTVEELPGVFTQVRRLSQARAMVADAVATVQGGAAADVTVDVVVELPDDLQADLDRAREARRVAVDLERQASEGFVAVASRLIDAGLTLREVGEVLQVSHQRVGQLVGTHASRRATAERSVRSPVASQHTLP